MALIGVKRPVFRFSGGRSYRWGSKLSTKQTTLKGVAVRWLRMLGGFLDGLLRESTGKSFHQWAEPARRRWKSLAPYREPVEAKLGELYTAVPRADLVLTAVATTAGLLAIRRGVRRYGPAHGIPSNPGVDTGRHRRSRWMPLGARGSYMDTP